MYCRLFIEARVHRIILVPSDQASNAVEDRELGDLIFRLWRLTKRGFASIVSAIKLAVDPVLTENAGT